jgi:glycosyltransferase involved in cell wall biosynthesis
LVRGREPANAIDQASLELVRALETLGHEANVIEWVPSDLSRMTRSSELLVLPYNPFMWGRWGYSPRLVWDVVSVRRRHPRPSLVLVIHEPYVAINDIKSLAMGSWQRAQLWGLMLLADYRFASIERWAGRLSRIRPTRHLPSGSNVPEARDERERVRDQLGAKDAFVVATLSTGHPSHLRAYVEAALEGLADGIDHELVFLRLGAGAPDVHTPDSVRTIAPGLLSPRELGAYVAAADLLLLPFVDGVSTRRSSMMAGLCEGVCVVGTAGKLTDPSLASAGLELVEVGQPAAFAERAIELALDPERRARSAQRGLELFDARFAWNVTARTLIETVG